jgi:hypothetical protein
MPPPNFNKFNQLSIVCSRAGFSEIHSFSKTALPSAHTLELFRFSIAVRYSREYLDRLTFHFRKLLLQFEAIVPPLLSSAASVTRSWPLSALASPKVVNRSFAIGHRIRRKRQRLSSNDPIETAPAERIGLNPASSAGAVPIGT